jgi:hypothetical protein
MNHELLANLSLGVGAIGLIVLIWSLVASHRKEKQVQREIQQFRDSTAMFENGMSLKEVGERISSYPPRA